VNVLLLDGLNTRVGDQVEVRRQMLKFVGGIAPGTSMAIFTLSSRLRMVTGFTTEAPELMKALLSAQARVRDSVVLNHKNDSPQRDIEQIIATIETEPIRPPPETIAALLRFENELTTSQTDVRAGVTLDALQQLARYLSAIPGRKNLIWFSGAFPLALNQTASPETRRTIEMLNAARVAVYPVDAQGLANTPVIDSGNWYLSTGAVDRANSGFVIETAQEHASMKEIAEQTGGRDFVDSNGLKEAAASAVEDGESYYSLGYVPVSDKLDGRFRKIQVRIDGGKYALAYREGYFADPAAKPSAKNPGAPKLMQEAALHGAQSSTQVLFRLRVLPANDPSLLNLKLQSGPAGEMAATLKAPVHRSIAELAVDPHTITFNELKDGTHQAQLEFVLVAYNSEGGRLNYIDQSFAINVKPEQFAQTMAEGIPARLALDLPAGRGSLRVVVEDLIAGKAGSLELPVSVSAK
jgi:VWFA-related protein